MNSLTSRSKPISQILNSTSRRLYISLFSTSTPQYNGPARRQEEESRNVRVSVWWDIENCGVPTGINVFKIAHSITSAVRANGIKGPVQITAFGDIFCLNRASQEALSSTGVSLVHIPHGGKNSADRSLLVDLMYWVSQNPPPAHIFLISGDRDFAGILHKLRMSNYNILLAAREANQTPSVLYSSSTIMWHWNELAKGENLAGKHFNQPPDGPFNSWYGHYRGPLEDPFGACKLQKASEPDDSSNAAEQSAENRYRPVPMAVLRQLRRVVNSHPEGLTITELRDHLLKNKVSLDKDFYGYKKFSRFLQALPRIVTVESRPDGQFFLHPVVPEIAEKNDTSAPAKTVNSNRGTRLTAKENSESPTITRMVESEQPTPVSTDEKETIEKPAEETSEKKVSDAIHNGKDALNAKIAESSVTPIGEQNSKQKTGLFRILWTKMFPRSTDAEETGQDDPKRLSTLSANPEKSIPEEEKSKLSNHTDVAPAHPSSNTASNQVAKVETLEKPEASPGFIGKIINWCKFWKNESSSDKPIELPDKELSSSEEDTRQVSVAPHSKKWEDDVPRTTKHELFTKDTFWNALRSYFNTNRGSEIVLNAMSRQQLAERLQKEGPLFLRPLQAIDICHLVDLLVSEKNWIKEFPTKNPRFRIVNLSEEPSKKNLSEESSATAQPHSSTGLSSIFLSSSSHEYPQSRVSPVVHKQLSEKPRSEILADCQKLLEELFSLHPDGFNMGIFKKHFLDKYGYALDHQKLGYLKLVSLLQMMPGVKVDSNLLLPDSVIYAPGIQSLGSKEKSAGTDSEMSDSAQKDDDAGSPWEELGPVAKSKLSSPDEGNGVYEPSMSGDDELSDTEEEESSSSVVKQEAQSKTTMDEEDSSLLQILDSWYSTKDESNPREHSSDPETWVSSEDESSAQESSPAGDKDDAAPAVTNGRKHKPQKSYKFVAEPTEAKKDKLIDGILGSLKKSGESRVPSKASLELR